VLEGTASAIVAAGGAGVGVADGVAPARLLEGLSPLVEKLLAQHVNLHR
jgi:hypothetical protein